jgi:nucleotide-binding universal stress UspA family protein
MSNASRIFVAVDNSERATLVLDAAAKLASLTDGKLVLFRAVGISPELSKELLEVTDARLEEILLRNARADLEQRAKGIPAARIEKILVAFGTAWDEICRQAREVGADVIVIGSHGYSGFDRLLGTTAAKVVNHADRNVLVIRTQL